MGLATVRRLIDALVSLAFAIHANRGAYALLIGSGVSRPAGVPTGWEVVLDLISRVATLEDEQAGEDPASWYLAKYGEAPDYSKLLEALAPKAAERNRLLRRYFEPTDEEREQGLKVPTAAHRAIARLVRDGLFEGSVERFLAIKASHDEHVRPLSW